MTISSRGRRVLIVDDYADAVEATRLVLQILGYEYRAATTGSDAIALVDGFEPDVVLLDLGLPDMDGFEVAQRLRAKLGPAGPRIVALTGWTDANIPKRARAAGIDRVLLKPISATVLRAILDSRRE